MIDRNEYLDILKRFKDKEIIKVITGIRRCGKSTLLELYKTYLLNNYVFIDEVQKIDEFQKAVDGLYIKKNVDIYITGSNAKLLSSELATLLSGRYIEIKMLPLSFKEYRSVYKDLNNDELYQKYISFGSFPFTASLNTEDDVSLYLGSIYNDIIIKDVMARKKITDESTLRSVANFTMDNIGNLI